MTNGFIITACALLAGFLLGLLLPRFFDVPRIPDWLRWGFVVILLIGGWLTISQSIHLKSYEQYKEWGIIQGKVTTAKVSDNASAYRPLISYVYLVDGERYTGSSDMDVPGFGDKARMYNVADETVKQYAPGSIVPVYYNPTNPSESRLRVTPTWDVFAQIGFGGFLVICAAFGALLPKRRPATVA